MRSTAPKTRRYTTCTWWNINASKLATILSAKHSFLAYRVNTSAYFIWDFACVAVSDVRVLGACVYTPKRIELVFAVNIFLQRTATT